LSSDGEYCDVCGYKKENGECEMCDKEHMKKDLNYGYDCRSDWAFFIHESHINQNGELDDQVVHEILTDPMPIFFRVINDHREIHTHGWIDKHEGEIKIIQWG
jgi:hypothetical protein